MELHERGDFDATWSLVCDGTPALGGRSPGAGEACSLGFLTCTAGDGGTLACGFKPTGSGAEEKYVGTVGGRADTLAGKIVLIWAVTGPADMKVSAGMLAQRFVKGGQSAQPPTLVGEKNSSIVLQFETNNGSDATAAITHIDLKLAATPA